jgi:hypothetical protein
MAARHLGALKSAIRSLHKYYDFDLQVINALADRPDPRFPHQAEYTSLATNETHHFKYVFQQSEKLVFFGQTDDGKSICIKFVRSYSKNAHEICASMGIAPELKGFQVVPGGWHMVIMDVVAEKLVAPRVWITLGMAKLPHNSTTSWNVRV